MSNQDNTAHQPYSEHGIQEQNARHVEHHADRGLTSGQNASQLGIGLRWDAPQSETMNNSTAESWVDIHISFLGYGYFWRKHNPDCARRMSKTQGWLHGGHQELLEMSVDLEGMDPEGEKEIAVTQVVSERSDMQARTSRSTLTASETERQHSRRDTVKMLSNYIVVGVFNRNDNNPKETMVIIKHDYDIGSVIRTAARQLRGWRRFVSLKHVTKFGVYEVHRPYLLRVVSEFDFTGKTNGRMLTQIIVSPKGRVTQPYSS